MQLPEGFKHFLEINPARHKTEGVSVDPCFSHLIVHKEIQGDKIFVPLDLTRVWDRL
ncbi:hypothetical protein [Peribacillus simplex]|uniref:Uncharacterized protein n=1 Tax=Peribacillus simplex TaxID=1478 RepID=A0AAN2PDZ1_9BACI|nr:hypothetical protein [Peribacillus simplex]CEG24895.1 hypothetical protein BN1180_05738 [Peribacillus simplex]